MTYRFVNPYLSTINIVILFFKICATVFLISLKKGSPDYGLINIKCVDKLPAVQWKLMNIKKMPSKTHKKALNKLRSVLEL